MRGCFLFLLFSLSAPAFSQEYKSVSYTELIEASESLPDTLTIINFWATWCKPCIEEMPYLDELNEETVGQPVRVILVSVDDENRWESALIPFLEKKQLKSEVWALQNDKPWDWIDRVSTKWSGAIPATLMLYEFETILVEETFTRETLKETIQTFLNNK